jgi:hypothetical protein
LANLQKNPNIKLKQSRKCRTDDVKRYDDDTFCLFRVDSFSNSTAGEDWVTTAGATVKCGPMKNAQVVFPGDSFSQLQF